MASNAFHRAWTGNLKLKVNSKSSQQGDQDMKRRPGPLKARRARRKPVAYDHSQLRWQVVKRARGVAEEVKKFQPSLDLDFKGAKTAYATHAMHSFSAKFPPQLASWAIQEFTKPRENVMDPMAGSGTTLVEACLLGRNSYGIDIDPLARLISKVKSTPIDFWTLQGETNRFEVSLGLAFKELERARRNGIGLEGLKRKITIPVFLNRDYWFLPEISEELALLKSEILNVANPEIRDFLFVVFSSIIITKGKTSVANVMDLAHSRPHYAKPEAKPDTLKLFIDRLAKLRKSMEKFSANVDPN
ncbi:MAG: DNA methyltransferase, partial [Terriglobia bacterium]